MGLVGLDELVHIAEQEDEFECDLDFFSEPNTRRAKALWFVLAQQCQGNARGIV